MKNNYLSFDRLETRREYTNKIKEMFNDNNLNWTASSSINDSYIFIRPKDSFHWNKFLNVTRMSIHTKEGVLSFGVSGSYQTKDPLYRKTFEKKGYYFQESPNPKGRWWLIKPIDLGEIVREIRDIEPILLKKKKD